jgi:hypothetical protein
MKIAIEKIIIAEDHRPLDEGKVTVDRTKELIAELLAQKAALHREQE